MEEKKYVTPKVEIIEFEAEDVITTSLGDSSNPPNPAIWDGEGD